MPACRRYPLANEGEFRLKTLPPIRPTAEQLPLISDNSMGVEIIRGAAGSGKTSTAILRLRSLAYMLEERQAREERDTPVKILVLTFNRTLSGYVQTLVDQQVHGLRHTEVTINTFGRWAMEYLGRPNVVRDNVREAKLVELAAPLQPPSPQYIVKEVDYLLGRFAPGDLESYIRTERTGRGLEPRVDRTLRRRILDEVVAPYRAWLAERSLLDWNDVALRMIEVPESLDYDIVVVDESQDFSANQLRAVRRHVAEEHAVTFVIDTIQRIYARGFTWAETGFDLRGARYFTLAENHRNTRQTAAFASGLLAGLVAEPDGALPDLRASQRDGELPVVLRGRFSQQAAWAIDYIENNVDLENETVAFLHPRGYGFFKALREYLTQSDIDFVEISREAEWPEGNVNVALSTFHSAKGLEFDYVFILGLNHEATGFADAALDDQVTVMRRLLAVAVARARNAVILGYKEREKSRIVDYFAAETFRVRDL